MGMGAGCRAVVAELAVVLTLALCRAGVFANVFPRSMGAPHLGLAVRGVAGDRAAIVTGC